MIWRTWRAMWPPKPIMQRTKGCRKSWPACTIASRRCWNPTPIRRSDSANRTALGSTILPYACSPKAHDALVRMFEQALATANTLPTDTRDAMIARLDKVRSISRKCGYGVGDDMDSLLNKYNTRKDHPSQRR